MATWHVAQMNANLQLGPRVEDLSETDERTAQAIKACHDHSVPWSQNRHQFPPLGAIL
jgi:hypothetical protein